MYKLKRENYEKGRPLLKGLMEYNLHINAILEGTSKGQIFVDNLDNPQSVHVLTPIGTHYLAGYRDNKNFNKELHQKIPDDRFFVLWYSPDNWESKFNVLLKKRFARKATRLYYKFKEPKIRDWKEEIPSNYHLKFLNREFIEQTKLKNIDAIREWISTEWTSFNHFFEEGFGFGLVNEEKDVIVSWSLTDYVSKEHCCEIGVTTDRNYRKKGFGILTVSATVEFCLSNGFTEIGWHCWDSNLGSITIAEKVGFELERRYFVYLNHWAAENVTDWTQERFRAFAEDYEQEFKIETPNTGYPYVVASKAGFLAGEFHPAIEYLHKAINTGFLRTIADLKGIWPELFIFGNHHDREEWKELISRLEGARHR